MRKPVGVLVCKRVTATAKEPGFCLGRGGEVVKGVPLGIGLGAGVGFMEGKKSTSGCGSCTHAEESGTTGQAHAVGSMYLAGTEAVREEDRTSAGSWGQLAKGSLARLRSSDVML